MAVPIFIVFACGLDLVVTAVALGLGLRRARPLITVLATGAVSAALVAAILAVWWLWFVAPACVLGAGGCAVPAQLGQALDYACAAALGGWALMAGVAFVARSLKLAAAGTRAFRIAE